MSNIVGTIYHHNYHVQHASRTARHTLARSVFFIKYLNLSSLNDNNKNEKKFKILPQTKEIISNLGLTGVKQPTND